MELKQLPIKASTQRNIPFRSPIRKHLEIIIQNIILLGTAEQIKIVACNKQTISNSIILQRNTSTLHYQNVSQIQEFDSQNKKHKKAASLNLTEFSSSLLPKFELVGENCYFKLVKQSYRTKITEEQDTSDNEYESQKILQIYSPKNQLHKIYDSGLPKNKCLQSSIKGQITFETGHYFEGQLKIKQGLQSIEGFGILYVDNSKKQIVYKGEWRNSQFSGNGRYYNQYQLSQSSNWHHNWNYLEAQFKNNQIEKGIIHLYNQEGILINSLHYFD